MKKLFITAMFLLTLHLSANAANGDIVGNIYSTDIRAYINDIEVESYCIDGKTVVVVEDIFDYTQYEYNDNERLLKILSFDPDGIKEGKNKNTSHIGTVVGNVYETDIKTSIYDSDISSYCLDGKTAVAIEDLGYDSVYSPFGAMYQWNDIERTIKLRFMYDNSDILPENKRIRITVNEDLKSAEATFEEVIHCEGGQEVYTVPKNWRTHAQLNIPICVKTDGSSYVGIGYYLRIPTENGSFTDFTYYYPKEIKWAQYKYTPIDVTPDSVINHFQTVHYSGVYERFDTSQYSIAWMGFAFPMGSSNYLVQVFSDGTYKDYLDDIRHPNRYIEDFKIDKENEKVTFRYADQYTLNWFTSYEIDLKTGTIIEVKDI